MHDQSLRELAEQKEREWRELQELRAKSLEEGIKDREKQLNDERLKFQKLKDDFKYNFKLLQERDLELERYDSIFGELKATVTAKNVEISELKIKIDELKLLTARENQSREELQIHYQQRLREKQREVDGFRCAKDAELKKDRDELEMFKRNLRRELQEVEEELETQRYELNAGFDDAIRKREHEYRVQMDDLSAKVLSYEMKAKILAKELEVVRSASETTSTDLKHADSTTRQLEKKLKEKEWELNDTKAMKVARIQELESKMHQQELSVKRAQEDFQRRHAEMDRYAREKEGALTAAKESHNERERSLQDNIRDLQSQVEAKEVEIRRLNWAHDDTMKNKDIIIEKMQQELSDFKTRSDTKLADVSHDIVSKDLELQALRSTEEKLRAEMAQRKEDVERYKKELSQAMERETSLERAKAQLELDWQRRCEDTERVQYQHSEELVHKLTVARDEALALVKERERELGQREDLIRVLSQDRDQAMATLRQHGLNVDRHIIPTRDVGSDGEQAASQQIQILQQQNDSLRQVIRQMREEMEKLDLTKKQNIGEQKGPITEDYVQALEKEVRELKTKVRDVGHSEKKLPEQIADIHKELTKDSIPISADNAYVRSHIQSLNDTIGALRADKVEAAAQIKKLQTRAEHLESLTNQATQQAKQKQLEADQLSYEVSTQQRRYTAEITMLRNQLAEIQLQLAETRKEADEYFKGGMERNLEATALGQEVSALKMDIASRKPTIIQGSQNALVKQLQEEVHYLRSQLNNVGEKPMRDDVIFGGSDNVQLMQAKLRTAARHITQLTKERQKLIQLGNKLRAELVKYTGGKPVSPPQPPATERQQPAFPGQRPAGTAGEQLVEQFQTKLSDLERLQYELTKQELKFAQRDKSPRQMSARGAGDHAVKEMTLEEPVSEYTDVRTQPIQPHALPGRQPDLQTTLSTIGSGLAGSPLLMSMSSTGEGSIQDVWRLLDYGPSPSPPPPMMAQQPQGFIDDDNFEPRPTIDTRPITAPGGFTIEGSRPHMQERHKPERKLSSLAAGKYQRPTPKQKVRNYNVHH